MLSLFRLALGKIMLENPRTNPMNTSSERFYRVDKARSKAIGGTGLGLAIVKHGATYHNAEIELESKENVGTSVSLVF